MTVAPRLRLDLFLTALEEASEPDQITDILQDIRLLIEVAHVAFHRVRPTAEPPLFFATYPDDWAQRFREREYYRINPSIRGAITRPLPLNCKELDWSDKQARTYLQDAIAHGIGTQGYTVPVHGPAGQVSALVVSKDCSDTEWEAIIARHRRCLILLAHTLLATSLRLHPVSAPKTTKPLSPREHDTLSLLAQGYTRAQVAQKLSISQHTLRVYIESARHKLGATNAVHTVARALSQGVVDL